MTSLLPSFPRNPRKIAALRGIPLINLLGFHSDSIPRMQGEGSSIVRSEHYYPLDNSTPYPLARFVPNSIKQPKGILKHTNTSRKCNKYSTGTCLAARNQDSKENSCTKEAANPSSTTNKNVRCLCTILNCSPPPPVRNSPTLRTYRREWKNLTHSKKNLCYLYISFYR